VIGASTWCLPTSRCFPFDFVTAGQAVADLLHRAACPAVLFFLARTTRTKNVGVENPVGPSTSSQPTEGK
jgi:hypothetical protein